VDRSLFPKHEEIVVELWPRCPAAPPALCCAQEDTMQTYKAPVRDMMFALHELHGLDSVDPDLAETILNEAAKLAEQVLAPLNASGDLEGCVLENGVVRTPGGFRQAYRAFREGGWQSLAGEVEYGGQGLPESLNKLVEEMVCSANLSFSLYSILTHSACSAIFHHGSPELRATYLAKLTEGVWSGTMCLTEAQCGTDLSLLRTRARPAGDGSHRVTGTKIFITSGEHDLTENIIHLVLARLPDAPAGVKGISLFLVPKFIPDAAGRPGARNGMYCSGLEHKLGIRASATCQLQFEEATGWLVGEPHKGLRAMFTMMNGARLSVGIEGVGIAEAAYQGAVAYARDRLQGRASESTGDRAADPLLVHADVRRMLLTMRAHAEGGRALGVWLASQLDLAATAPTPAAREEAEDLAAVLTPVVKALCTDLGFEAASLGVQVYGGHGYIRDHGMEQYLRDARIAMLYEGTNGVQAMDLAGRKLPAQGGRLLHRFIEPIAAFIEANGADPALAAFVGPLGAALEHLRDASDRLRVPAEVGAAASDYLRLFGLTALGFMWARAAALALPRQDDAFYRAKLRTARFFMERILPQTGALLAAIGAGGGVIEAFEDAAF